MDGDAAHNKRSVRIARWFEELLKRELVAARSSRWWAPRLASVRLSGQGFSWTLPCSPLADEQRTTEAREALRVLREARRYNLVFTH